MKIEKIHIANFRGFEDRTFELHPEMTVVVGNNTSGKTTLLQAIQVALGGYLKCLKGLPNDRAYSHNFTSQERYKRYNENLKEFIPNDGDTFVEMYAVSSEIYADNRQLYWKRTLRGSTTSQSQAESSSLYEYVRRIEKSREGDVDTAEAYPLILSFGANRIDNQYRASNKTKARETRVAKGYKSALRETVDFKSAFDWLYRFNTNVARGQEFPMTRDAFLLALKRAIPAMSDIHIDDKNNEFSAKVSVRGQAPVYATYDDMSDGFKSVICLVAEIAYRCIELNGFMDANAILETPGIVMIDEIDLYLHPRWQRHILSDLKNAFPKIQFIVTSHSPFIIQSVKRENLIVLDGKTDETDPVYRSIEEIVQCEMNMETRRSKRYEEMLDQAERYYQMVKDGNDDSMEAERLKNELDEIELEFSDDPAYVALLRAERRSK